MKPKLRLLLLSCAAELLMCLEFSQAQSAWEWQNPLPQGNALKAVQFIGADTGYAVGEFGTVMRSTDAGTTWERCRFNSTVNLNSLSFLDSRTGYVGSSSLFFTSNGGETWIDYGGCMECGAGIVFSFANALTGIRSGWFSPPYPWLQGAVSIDRTSDGGHTWSHQRLFSSSNGPTFAGFLSTDIGFVAGPFGIERTTNTGIGWTHVSGADVRAISFSTYTKGLAVGTGILLTIDSGSTWAPQQVGTSQILNRVWFADSTTAFAVGAVGTIMRSTNGGANWDTQISGTSMDLYGVHGIDAHRVVAVGAGGVILRTTNSGATWVEVTSGARDHIYAIAFTDTMTGFGVGTSGSLLTTTNGGSSWQRNTIGTTRKTLYKIRSLNHETAVVVGDSGTILKSTDGGQTWEDQSFPTSYTLFDISFPTLNTGYAVGDRGTFLHTTDGGASWTTLPSSPIGQAIYAVQFFDENNGVVAGSGRFSRTTDGGNTWIETPIGPIVYLYGLLFLDSNRGFMVGLRYDHICNPVMIARTTNGGQNWSFGEVFPCWQRASAIAFSDSLNGVCVGTGGVIVRSRDGGITWRSEYAGTNNSLFGVVAINANKQIAVGGFGTILQTRTGGVVSVEDGREVQVPDQFALGQNYPNPFNPTTKIEFRAASFGFVSLKVFDLLGREVATLVNEEMQPGSYERVFNAEGLASGVYLYLLRAGSFVQTKKLLLLR